MIIKFYFIFKIYFRWLLARDARVTGDLLNYIGSGVAPFPIECPLHFSLHSCVLTILVDTFQMVAR